MTAKYAKYEILMNWECNQRCLFCSTGTKFGQKKRIKPLGEIKKEIRIAKRNGADTISFSGGEPTIRRDLIDVIEFAEKEGFEKIEVQSNGMMYKYPAFVKEITEAGADRFLVSIHGANAKTHDFLTRTEGSFERAMAGIKNLKKAGVEIRFSIVINKHNFREAAEWAEMLAPYGAFSYHFIFVTPIGFAKNGYKKIAPRISETIPYIKDGIKVLDAKGLNSWVHNIYPCNMQGYEERMSELCEKHTMLSAPDFKVEIDRTRMDGRKKPRSCVGCKWDNLCVGPHEKYVELFGEKEFQAVRGESVVKGGFKVQKYGSG
ncbi:MAG: radical SAM protein [Candidatus Diapherotrites archaeon]|nr:radical SAM protein [Candidatus Diapherotrites archaeon]